MDYRGYQAVIGLEIHAQLNTESKIFSSDGTQFDSADNENTSPVSVGMPGALPVINAKVVQLAIKAGLALGCTINKKSVFSRKNYFYPDLPKGYQISQYDQPICEHGKISYKVENQVKEVSITRAHLEEDAGKSIHSGDFTLINYNRSGVPLLEIVSGPDMHTPAEAAEYAKTIRQILRYIDVCDGNLEQGSLRCDCNVSIRKVGAKELGTKVEIKNINSFRFIEKAIEFEIHRQIDAVESQQKIIQETRLWDPDKNRTFSMRVKEDAQDYRYFPDPDLLPLVLSQSYISEVNKTLAELPAAKAQRFLHDFKLSEYDVEILTQDRATADYFERTTELSKLPKLAANWIMTDLTRELNAKQWPISESPVKPEQLAELILLIDSGTISGKIAKTIFLEMWTKGGNPKELVNKFGFSQITDVKKIEELVDGVLAAHPKEVLEFKSGKTKILGFLIGAVMKASKGQASPELLSQIINEKLKD